VKTMEWELFRLLTDCLKKNESAFDAARLTDLSSKRWQAFLTLAKTQQVMPLLWHRLRQKGLNEAVPLDVAESLREASRRNTLHNLRFYGELRRLLSALRSLMEIGEHTQDPVGAGASGRHNQSCDMEDLR